MKILFAGGGSGGHLFPGIAVAEELERQCPSCQCVFAGSNREIEKEIFQRYGYDHFPLALAPSSDFLKSPFTFLLANWRAYRSAEELINRTSPDGIVGLGGFASLPVVLAGWRRGVPVVLMEQNAVLGRANRLLLPAARQICLSYPQTPLPGRSRRKSRVTGNPVRRQIIDSIRDARDRTNDRRTLLILGGSQGAVGVNEAFLKVLPKMRTEFSDWRIGHQTGSKHYESVRGTYCRLGIQVDVSPFFEEMGSIYAKADLVLARAGGTTLAELAVHNLPAVLIPYPGSIRNHQELNAEHYARSGGAVVLPQSQVVEQTARQLGECLEPLLTDPRQRASMRSKMRELSRPDAARDVAEAILRCGLGKPGIPFRDSQRTKSGQTQPA